MIQIEAISIREFRGIREVALHPYRKNFVVSGPNGSGRRVILVTRACEKLWPGQANSHCQRTIRRNPWNSCPPEPKPSRGVEMDEVTKRGRAISSINQQEPRPA